MDSPLERGLRTEQHDVKKKNPLHLRREGSHPKNSNSYSKVLLLRSEDQHLLCCGIALELYLVVDHTLGTDLVLADFNLIEPFGC